MRKGEFSKKIISWYGDNHRDLPWRKTKDPYRIWLSEVMLQQTRVVQGLPYYLKFIRNFPNVKALANASEQKVLRAWQGLGYYSRARNLHACAKKIVLLHKGKFPNTYEELLTLPGIGSYTAAAIASIAFNQPVAVVDGNVFRVLSRVFGIEEDIGSTIGKKVFEQKANELMDATQAGIFNQAVMEFGALYCSPKSPDCERCIFSSNCIANVRQIQDLLPFKEKKVKVRNRYFTYFLFRNGKKLAMKKRNGKDIWSGLYDFYLVEERKIKKTQNLILEDAVLKKFIKPDDVAHESELMKHVLTHQRITARFVIINLKNASSVNALLRNSGLKFYTAREIEHLPKPVLISRFLSKRGIF